MSDVNISPQRLLIIWRVRKLEVGEEMQSAHCLMKRALRIICRTQPWFMCSC
jgi:hypothetical protein